MTPLTYVQFIKFLRDELALPAAATAIAQRHCASDPGPLPMVLWHYGLITMDQLEQILDWMETT